MVNVLGIALWDCWHEILFFFFFGSIEFLSKLKGVLLVLKPRNELKFLHLQLPLIKVSRFFVRWLK